MENMDIELMKTALVDINPVNPEEQIIRKAAKILKEGGIVAFPTETVYGLGANGLDPAAVGKIFTAKGRPADNPLILHIGDRSMLADLAEEIPVEAYRLIDKFWPGPLTIVLKKISSVPNTPNTTPNFSSVPNAAPNTPNATSVPNRTKTIPDIVTSGLDTVGIRMPSSPVFLALSRECRFPIAAPSANSFGKPSPTTAEDVLEDMNGKIPLILSAGKCSLGIESTIISFAGSRPKLLRPGGVSLEEIEKLIGPVELHPTISNPESTVETAESPGMKYRHYSPEAEIILAGSNNAVLSFLSSSEAAGKKLMIITSTPGTDKNSSVSVNSSVSRGELLDHNNSLAAGVSRDHNNSLAAGVSGKPESIEQSAHGFARWVVLDQPENFAENIYALFRKADRERFDIILVVSIPEKGIGLGVMNRLKKAAGRRIE